MQKLGEQAFPGSGHQLPQEEEMRRLQRENELLRKARDILKKPSGHLLAQPADIAFRSLHNTVTSTRLGCCAPRLRLKTRGSYAWKKREPSQQSREDAVLHAAIQQSFVEFRQVYGSPRLHAVLKSRGIACSRKRIARLMRASGLVSTREETTETDHAQ